MALLTWAVPCLGCRTVWMHPEASPGKFEADKAQCEREVASPPPGGPVYRNWKACLLANGWTATSDFRFRPAVRKPWVAANSPGPRGRRE